MVDHSPLLMLARNYGIDKLKWQIIMVRSIIDKLKLINFLLSHKMRTEDIASLFLKHAKKKLLLLFHLFSKQTPEQVVSAWPALTAKTQGAATAASHVTNDGLAARRISSRPKRIAQPNRRFIGPEWDRWVHVAPAPTYPLTRKRRHIQKDQNERRLSPPLLSPPTFLLSQEQREAECNSNLSLVSVIDRPGT